MNNRRRINISIDQRTYEDLDRMKKAYGFINLCEMVVALVHVLIDRNRSGESSNRKYDISDEDGNYIDEMFDGLSHTQRTPNGNPPKRHKKSNIYGKG